MQPKSMNIEHVKDGIDIDDAIKLIEQEQPIPVKNYDDVYDRCNNSIKDDKCVCCGTTEGAFLVEMLPHMHIVCLSCTKAKEYKDGSCFSKPTNA